ncbi:MAG: HAMP domain-containing protein [Dehalococcoidia bacterium]|jgi:methyl-accepting chemotaxis protein|nr:HAMP domain-containing protein [Dehalococcoidia bacterium]
MRLTIQSKLYGGFGVALAFLLVVSGIAYFSLGSVASGTDSVQRAGRMDDSVMSMIIALADAEIIEGEALLTSDTATQRAAFEETEGAFKGALAVMDEIGIDEARAQLPGLEAAFEEFSSSVNTTFDLIESSGSSGATINIAGRQRMLSQKMTKEALQVAAGGTAALASLEATASEFDATLDDLVNGNAERGIPTPQGDVLAQLETVRALWEPFHEEVEIVLTAAVDSTAFSTAIEHITSGNLALLTESNAAVGMYAAQLEVASAHQTANSVAAYETVLATLDGIEPVVEAFGDASLESAVSTKNSSTLIVIVVSAVAVAVAAGLAFWITRGIVGGVKQVAAAAEGIAVGDLQQEVSVSTNDEIGDMAVSFVEMIEYLRNAAGAADQIAVGDLNINVTPKSSNDTLGNAFVGMQGYLQEMVGHADRIADGDLTVDVTTRSGQDALANAFLAMVTNLRQVLGETQSAATALSVAKDQLAEIAEQASTATQEVATTIGQVAEGSSEQARRVQDVNHAVEELNTSADELDRQARDEVAAAADRVSEGSTEAREESKGASERAERGAEMVQQTVEGIERIKNTIDSASQEITVLGERSQEIGKIVAVIEDIAAQTNLLALNAAIEAARAGEQGRGFAVVADEVRQLAERVAGATKEIAELIGGVQEGVDSSVKVMEEGVREMETGTQSAAEASEALQEILAAVSTVGNRIEEITTGASQLQHASSSMVEVIGQVKEIATTTAESVGGIASVAEENSAATEQVSASSEEMSAQVEEVTASTLELGRVSERLQEQLSTFQLEGGAARLSVVDEEEGQAA